MKNFDDYLQQVALKALGFDPGPLDGDAGPRTREAYAACKASLTSPERHITQNGVDLIKHFEGLYLKAYNDGGGVITIGYGHTGLKHNDGTVYLGRRITEQEAEDLLRYDMNVFERRVVSLVTVPLNDDEFDALVSFDFNTGGLDKSTLLRKLNKEDRLGSADELMRWTKDNGKVLVGLVRRRKSERLLFLGKRPFIVEA